MSGARTYLVTGGTGFIGTHLCRRLISDGHSVHVVVEPTHRDVVHGASAHELDGTTGGMLQILDDTRPDLVFHLASLFLSTHRPEDIAPLIASNVLLGTQVLEAMAQVGCKRLVNVGTGWQHYEGAAYDPVNLYAATKQAFEDIAAYYVAQGVGTTTLALYDTYGPDDLRPKILPRLLDAATTGAPLDLSPGEQLLHIVYIDDVIEAFVVAAGLLDVAPAPAAKRYCIAADSPISLREIASAVERVTGRVIDAHWGARDYREREVMVPWVGEHLPGWHPKVPIEDGIRRLLDSERKS